MVYTAKRAKKSDDDGNNIFLAFIAFYNTLRFI